MPRWGEPRHKLAADVEEGLWRHHPNRRYMVRASGATVVTFEDCTFESGPVLRVDGKLTVTGDGILLGAPASRPQYGQGMTRGHWRGSPGPWGGWRR